MTEPTEIMPASLLADLRRLDAARDQLNREQDALLRGYLAARNIDLSQETVNFNIDTGVVTRTVREEGGQ